MAIPRVGSPNRAIRRAIQKRQAVGGAHSRRARGCTPAKPTQVMRPRRGFFSTPMPTCDCCENDATHTTVTVSDGERIETPYCQACDPGNDTKHVDAVYETIKKCEACGESLCRDHKLIMQTVGTSGLG